MATLVVHCVSFTVFCRHTAPRSDAHGVPSRVRCVRGSARLPRSCAYQPVPVPRLSPRGAGECRFHTRRVSGVYAVGKDAQGFNSAKKKLQEGVQLSGPVHTGCTNLCAYPLMLLASCVNTPIDHSVFHYLDAPVTRCSVSCVNGA